MAAVRARGSVRLLGEHEAELNEGDLVLHRRQSLPFHPNGMRYHAYDEAGRLLRSRTCYSVGGGFVVDEPADDAAQATAGGSDDAGLPYLFGSAAELLDRCTESGLPVSGVMLANEASGARPRRCGRGCLRYGP